LSCCCKVSVTLFFVVTISLAAFFFPLPPTANKRQPHAAASHLPPIPILITTKLAITLAIKLIIAIAVTVSVAVAIAVPVAVAIGIAVPVAVAISVAFAIALAVTVAIAVALAIAIAIAFAITIAVAVAFACVICTRTAHDNTPTCRHLQEGCGKSVLPGRRRLLIRLKACKEISSTELEKIYVVMVVYTVFHCREGKIKKSANVAALPGEGGMPLHWQIN
jgi:hypothetical protein